MLVYVYDEETKEFLYSEEAFIDPLESELKQKSVYILPANATFEKPIEKECGKAVIYNGTAWVLIDDNRGKLTIKHNGIQEIKKLGTDELPLTEDEIEGLNLGLLIIEDNKVIEKPQSLINQERIAELKRNLSNTDYVVVKIAEGVATKEEYADIIAQRQSWRDEINACCYQYPEE